MALRNTAPALYRVARNVVNGKARSPEHEDAPRADLEKGQLRYIVNPDCGDIIRWLNGGGSTGDAVAETGTADVARTRQYTRDVLGRGSHFVYYGFVNRSIDIGAVRGIGLGLDDAGDVPATSKRRTPNRSTRNPGPAPGTSMLAERSRTTAPESACLTVTRNWCAARASDSHTSNAHSCSVAGSW